jgi:serine-type D-Ala-D-Ala carboxypeptidase (penicillin-binding protein 5/6)
MTVLQTVNRGKRRRRGRGMRLAIDAVVAVVLGVALLLVVMAANASSPAISSRVAAKSARLSSRPPHGPVYGLSRAPTQVKVPLKAPLRSGLLFNVQTGQVLWSRDAAAVLPIASLTKMMTALVVVSHTRPTDRVLVTPQAVHFSGSGMGVLPDHKQVLVKTLLYGLLLPSGNDAAIALAQHVGGTLDRFIAMMNARARAMGLSCTHFATVSGIVDRGNHSCTQDLATLAHAVLNQPLLAQIVSSASAVEPLPIKGGKVYLYNNNPLLIERYPGTDGVKTGFTTAAGQCLVATARRGHAWLGVVLLHSANIATQGTTILNAGFAALAPARHHAPGSAPPKRSRHT